MGALIHNVEKIFGHFETAGGVSGATPCGSGHINDTFLIHCDDGSKKKNYVLQRINHCIFKNPPDLMDNIARVSCHIRMKLEGSGNKTGIDRRVLTIIPNRSGQNYYQDSDGNFWRVYVFIEGARTYNVPKHLDQMYEAARAFGNFQNQLVDLPQPALFDTIPDFHNGLKRLEAFQCALQKDCLNRARNVKSEIDFLLSHGWIFEECSRLIEKKEICIRTTHNDAKINNVLIDDRTHEGVCVIDLDTVMPGLVIYDVGDLLRTTLSAAAEDEKDLSRVYVEIPRFEAVIKGYLESAGAFLSRAETEHLIFGGKMITLIMGARFLTDFLNGDTYFKVHRDNHNLDRCRTQFKLVQSIIEQEEQMIRIVENNLTEPQHAS
jgi:aminoglycoside phosphotransferase (APT) family kinase protein